MPRIREFRYDSWAQWTIKQILHDLPAAIAVDTETTGLAWADVPFCATLTWRSQDGTLRSGYIGLDSEDTLPLAGAGRESPIGDLENRISILRGILEWVPTWVFWNAKFDLEKLANYGALPAVEGHTIEDGQPLASILDENRRMALKVRAVEDLGYVDTIMVETKSGPNKGKKVAKAKQEYLLGKVRKKLGLTKNDGYHLLPREFLIPYAITDTELTLRWWEKYRPTLPEAWEPVYAEEIEVINVLWRMESNGVGVDVPYLREQNDEWGPKVLRLQLKLVELSGRADFNPGSWQQLKVAFDAAGVKLESTDKEHIRDMLADPTTPPAARELGETLGEYRSAKGIYDDLKTLLDEQVDGIAHPWFNSVGPRTGRMSSSASRS
jgi:DNA polymerase I-like protein with 3'-5' exonuclease and polymerase domains